jgi:hypothetical protein
MGGSRVRNPLQATQVVVVVVHAETSYEQVVATLAEDGSCIVNERLI